MNTLPPLEEMWQAFVARDASYDGVFLACVKTTGIVCRPTCRARKPKPENVEFLATLPEALHGGYRPCKVCKPEEVRGEEPAWAEELVERIGTSPSRRMRDEDLRAEGIDPAAARRWFKRRYGVTFQGYQRAWRMGAALRLLSRGASISEAAYDSGYESESGFRDAFVRTFGHPPGVRDDEACLRARWIATPVGPMVGIASEKGITLCEFVDRRALETEIGDVRARTGAVVVPGEGGVLQQLEDELTEYFAGERREFDVPLDYPATPFQGEVWEELRRIPYGETRSYGQMAVAVGRAGASRAVGRANGQNRIAIVIPCHRVVRADGELSGYGGGRWRKQRLLELEGVLGEGETWVGGRDQSVLF